jgi:hypothetical protein
MQLVLGLVGIGLCIGVSVVSVVSVVHMAKDKE